MLTKQLQQHQQEMNTMTKSQQNKRTPRSLLQNQWENANDSTQIQSCQSLQCYAWSQIRTLEVLTEQKNAIIKKHS